MKETELALAIIDYLEGYDIYKEVPYCGIIDIVAKKENIITAIECKCTLSFKVIEQAFKNKACSNFSYIAVPYGKDRHFAYSVCREFGIGVLDVVIKTKPFTSEIGYSVIETVRPSLNRRIDKLELHDWMKSSEAGSQNNRNTAFKNTVSEITQHLSRRPEQKDTIKAVMSGKKYHYSSNTSAMSSIINMCHRGVIKEFRFENGYLIINPKS